MHIGTGLKKIDHNVIFEVLSCPLLPPETNKNVYSYESADFDGLLTALVLFLGTAKKFISF